MAARLIGLFWLTVFVGHAILAILAWGLQPGGFPVSHLRFWSNAVAPIVVLALAIGAIWALHREWTGALRVLLPVWPAAWVAIAVTAKLMFPITLRCAWLVPIGAAATMAVAAWRFPAHSREPAQGRRAVIAGVISLSLLAGAALVATQYVPRASTHPVNARFPTLADGVSHPINQAGAVHLEGKAFIQTSDGSTTFRLSRMTVMVEPLLTFSSRSPDGCATALVVASERDGPVPRFREGCRDGTRSCSLIYDLAGQGPAFLDVRALGKRHALAVQAVCQLEQPVYSHLNSFCDFEVRGHRRLSFEFSPCRGAVIDVRPVDYPIGRPSRFAFLDRNNTFHVVEAESGEKGPYRRLVSGRLERGEPLSITLHDEGRPVGRITLADWSQQADTSLSPTAGWGVPVNAIEFSLSGEEPESPASIFVTLAGTSVGRGWDCVGHSVGVYRNRVLIEDADDSLSLAD
jgi:hypothetical protein